MKIYSVTKKLCLTLLLMGQFVSTQSLAGVKQIYLPKGKLLTCKALLSQVTASEVSVGTFLRLLKHGLNTPNGAGGTLLSPSELEEMLKSQKPVNPKGRAKNSLEQSYAAALEKALVGLSVEVWKSIKEKSSALLSEAEKVSEVVKQGEAVSTKFFRAKLIKEITTGIATPKSALYRLADGQFYYGGVSYNGLAFVRFDSDGNLVQDSIRAMRISLTDAGATPTFFAHSDGSMSLVHRYENNVIFYPVLDGATPTEKNLLSTFWIPRREDELDQVRLMGTGGIDTAKQVTYELKIKSGPVFLKKADGSSMMLSVSENGSYVSQVPLDAIKYVVNYHKKTVVEDQNAIQQRVPRQQADIDLNHFIGEPLVANIEGEPRALFIQPGRFGAGGERHSRQTTQVFEYDREAGGIARVSKIKSQSDTRPTVFNLKGRTWLTGVSGQYVGSNGWQIESSDISVWQYNSSLGFTEEPQSTLRYKLNLEVEVSSIQYSENTQLIAVIESLHQKTGSTVALFTFDADTQKLKPVWAFTKASSQMLQAPKFLRLSSGNILMAVTYARSDGVHLYLIDKDSPDVVQHVFTVPTDTYDTSVELMDFANGKIVLAVNSDKKIQFYDIFGDDK